METWYNDTVTNTTALLSHVEDMNKSIYYTIQNPNPELADCEPTILKVEVKVRGRANPQNYDYCLEYIFMELLLLLWFAKFWLSKIFERKTFFIAALFCRRVREHLGNKRELGFLYLRDEYKKEAKSFCSQRIQGALIAFCTFKTATINQHTFFFFPGKAKVKKSVTLQDYLDWKWWIGGIITIIVAFFGVCGNVTSMVVLSRPKIREVAFNQLLTCLCVVDTLFLACNSLSMAHALGHDNGK